MLTKYEEEEKNEKQNNNAIGFSSVVMGEPVEIHIDNAREITLNSDIWQGYVRQINDTIEQINDIPNEMRSVRVTTPRWIVPRPDEPDADITYDRPLAEIVSEEVTTLRMYEERVREEVREAEEREVSGNFPF